MRFMLDSTSKNVNGKCGRKSQQAACRDALFQMDMVEHTEIKKQFISVFRTTKTANQ
jgi:hypothetical protein